MVDIAIVQLSGPAAPKAVNYSLTSLTITFVFLSREPHGHHPPDPIPCARLQLNEGEYLSTVPMKILVLRRLALLQVETHRLDLVLKFISTRLWD